MGQEAGVRRDPTLSVVWGEAHEAWEALSTRRRKLVYAVSFHGGVCLITLVMLFLGLWWPAWDDPEFWILQLARSPIPATVFVVGLVAGLRAWDALGDIAVAQRRLELLVRMNERQEGGWS